MNILSVRTYKYAEAAINIAIIVAAVVLVVSCARHWLAYPESRGDVRDGLRIDMPSIVARQNSVSVLLVLQAGCRFCAESAPFYRDMVKRLQGHGVPVVAILPQPEQTSREYVLSLGLDIPVHGEVSLSRMHAVGTPTMLVVNSKGIVLRHWTGKIPAALQQGVVEQVVDLVEASQNRQ